MAKYHLGLLVVVVLGASCGSRLTVEKRLHRPGYHIEVGNTVKAEQKRDIVTVDADDDASVHVSDQNQKNEDDLIASSDNNILVTANEGRQQALNGTSNDHDQSNEIPTRHRNGSSVHKMRSDSKSSTADLQKLSVEEASKAGENGSNPVKTIGIILTFLGLLLALFISWLIGLILVIIGAVMWIAGGSGNNQNSSRENARSKNELQDVVYLKNGSIIRGLIIEQVPNVSLKVQTADGNVFVFQMDEVAKITKEPRP